MHCSIPPPVTQHPAQPPHPPGRVLPAQLGALFTHSMRPPEVSALARSGLPILVVVARQDRLIAPVHQYAVADRLEADRLELDAGHMMVSATRQLQAYMAAMIAGRPPPPEPPTWG